MLVTFAVQKTEVVCLSGKTGYPSKEVVCLESPLSLIGGKKTDFLWIFQHKAGIL